MPRCVWAYDLHVMLFESADIEKPPTACLRGQPFRSVNTIVKPCT